MTSSKDMNEKIINLDDEIPPLEDIDEQMIEEEVQIDEEGNNKNDDDDGFIMAKKSTKKRKLPPVSTEDVKMDVQQPEIKKGKEMINWEMRKISVPPHRYTPLKKNWSKLVTPIINELKMQIRYNLRTRNVEIRCPIADGNKTFLQKAADFVQAFLLGFNIEDAISLIRFDHIFMESFEINDVKTLRGDHLSRAIGRIAGKDGRVKATIESVTQTRIVLADDKIHLLGAFNNLRIARHTICSLILGTPINKIHGNLRSLASRLAEQL